LKLVVVNFDAVVLLHLYCHDFHWILCIISKTKKPSTYK